MASKALTLGTVKLVHSVENLTLVAKATAELQVEEISHQLTSELMKELLESGRLWVTRAAGFCFDVEILFNGKPVDTNCRLRVLESVGHRICDAKFWTFLSLSTFLDIPPESQKTRFSVKINESILPSGPTSREPYQLPSQNAELAPPLGVRCTKLERVRIQCDFIVSEDEPEPKRRKAEPLRLTSPEIMLLDPRSTTPNAALTQEGLDEVVRSLKSLPISIAQGFYSWNVSKLGTEIDSKTTSIHGLRSRKFPNHIVDVLKACSLSNLEKSRMGEAEKLELMKQTGLRRSQVTNALLYYKKKLLKDRVDNESRILLSPSTSVAPLPPSFLRVSSLSRDIGIEDDEMLFFQNVPESVGPNDAEMLFSGRIGTSSSSNTMPSTPSLIQDYSENKLNMLSGSFVQPLKRTISKDKNSNKLFVEDGRVTGNLVGCAVRALVWGHSHCQPSHGIVLSKPFLEIPLHAVAPSIFSPEFQKAMAHNSRYLPIISRSISTSLPHRAQSLALKYKLAKLIRMFESTIMPSDEAAPTSKVHLISSIFQSRIWAIMQRGLVDASGGRKVSQTDLKGDTLDQEAMLDRDEDFEDLFQDQPMPNASERWEAASNRDFDDLLDIGEEDEDFLDYLEEAERERLDTERETEEMLFGFCGEPNEGELLMGTEMDEDSLLQ